MNLQLIYILFLIQTASTYMFSYKQTIVMADQRQYLLSFFSVATNIIRYGLQIVVLLITRNFTYTLTLGIAITIVDELV